MSVMANEAADRREVRWSANRKTDVVLRLLRGERLEVVSRDIGVEAHRVAAWRDEFLAAGTDGLKGRTSTGDSGTETEARRRLREAEGKVGELTMENDILRAARERGLQIAPPKRPR